jgi:peptide/nickel transport system permease protein
VSVGTTTPGFRLRLPRASSVLARALGRRDGLLYAGLAIVGLVILASLIGHFVLPSPNQQDLSAPLQVPTGSHPFGTDELGRDVLSRTLAATWLDLSFAVGVTIVAVAIGLIVGTVAGSIGGTVEHATMRLVDGVIAFPSLVFVLGVITIIGPGVTGLVIGTVAAGWAFYARIARAEMLVLREKQFIQAAQTLGFSRRRVMLRHALPNLLRPIAVYSMADVVFAILTISSLSFLGLGVPPPRPEWGAIIDGGQNYLLSAWWISTLPGILVVLVGLGLTFIGDALGERLGVNQDAMVL